MKQHASQCRGCVDTVTDEYMMGWGVDPDQAGGATIFLFADGALIGNVRCQLDRADLVNVGLPTKHVGFQFQLPAALADGKPHELTARFAGGQYLEFTHLPGISQTHASVTMEQHLPLLSYVDGLVGGMLTGWVGRRLRPGGTTAPLDIGVIQEGTEIARFKANIYRPDAAKVMGIQPNCGFTYRPPARLRDGQPYRLHLVAADTGENLGGSPVSFQFPAAHHETRIAQLVNIVEQLTSELWRVKRDLLQIQSVEPMALSDYNAWSARYRSALHARRAVQRDSHPWPQDRQPLVSVLCPVYRPGLPDFRAAVASVLAQTYGNLELILVDDNSGVPELSVALKEMAAGDPRVRLITLKDNAGISGATNRAIQEATGQYIALFDHDDLLDPVAVEVLLEAMIRRGARVAYSDEDKVDASGRFSDPNLKSDWNHRLALTQNYVCHFLMIEAEALRTAGPFNADYDGAQDHDLVLRLSETVPAAQIIHVPEVLYHWRITPGSTASSIGAKSYAIQAGANAVRDHLKRRGHKVRVKSLAGITMYEVEWPFRIEPQVTVVIPFRDQVAMTERCLQALLRITRYKAFKVVLVDNWSTAPETAVFCARAAQDARVTVMRIEEPFNYSRLNNLACAAHPSPYYVFMNNDVFVEQPAWLRCLINEALADDAVGAVGAKLIYPDRTVQHGGVILGVGGVGDHAYRGRAIDDPFFMGRGLCAQELSAVTGALMLVRGDAFRAVGGFDETDLAVAYNDVDLCLKLRRDGRKVIYCPAVVAEHHESVSRGDDMAPTAMRRFVGEERVMLTRWADEIGHDPFYNPLFAREGRIFDNLADPEHDPQA